jgi:hypothetical protein
VSPTDASIHGFASTYAHRITAALPLIAAHRVSMYDARGQLCWQSTEDCCCAGDRQVESDVVRFALEKLGYAGAKRRTDYELPGQRTAVLLRAADGDNVLRGFVMLVIDNRRLRGHGQQVRDLPAPVQRALRDWAQRLASSAAALPIADLATNAA